MSSFLAFLACWEFVPYFWFVVGGLGNIFNGFIPFNVLQHFMKHLGRLSRQSLKQSKRGWRSST